MKHYRIDVTLKFEGFVDVNAESKQEAKDILNNFWGAVLGPVTTIDDNAVPDWDINIHCEKQINKIKLR